MNKTCWENFPNFKPSEFKCNCGCSPEVINMDCQLLFILQAVRNKYKTPVHITSGYRCQKYNDSLEGAVKESYHVKRKAADFYINGITNTASKRGEIIAFMKTLPGYRYAYHNEGKHPNMGNSIHIEVK